MIRRLIAIIDALGDRIHPIVVLMLRKQGFWKGMIPLTVGTHLLLLFIVMGGEQLTRSFGPGAVHFGEMYLSFLFMLPLVVPFGQTVQGYHFVHKSDPLLLSIPLSDRSVWFGFSLTGLYHGFAVWCYVVLTYSYCYALHWVSLKYVLLYPFLSLLAGYFFAALGLSIGVAARTAVQRGFLFPVWFLPMWYIFMLLIQPPRTRSMMLTPLFRVAPPALFEPICWVPVLILAVPAYLWAAWKLFHFNLPRQRPFFVKYGVSLLVYLMLTVCFVGLWFGLRFLLVA